MLRTGIFDAMRAGSALWLLPGVSVVVTLPVFLFNSACGEAGWMLFPMKSNHDFIRFTAD